MKRSRATTTHDQLRLFRPSLQPVLWEKLSPDCREEVIVLLSQLLLGAGDEERVDAEPKEEPDE